MASTPSTADALVSEALESIHPRPSDDASRPDKKNFAEKLSRVMAQAFAAAFRARGMTECLPKAHDAPGPSGGERRMAGGIGAKKVDVSWSTDTSGLILALSVKSINFPDARTRNFQKNLTNRRGDMLYEAVTLHRRFPFAVIGGFLFLDARAGSDGSAQRNSTLTNAHQHLRLFTGRRDPGSREDQLERVYIVQYDMSDTSMIVTRQAGWLNGPPVTLDETIDELMELIAERNADLYEVKDGHIKRT
jgi:hypothetical protein